MRRFFAVLAATFALTTSFHSAGEKSDKTSKKIAEISSTMKKSGPETGSSDEIYAGINFTDINRLNPDVFKKALAGFSKLKSAGKLCENAHLLSICDFSLSSNQKRLWVIDLDAKKVLFNSLVAHGKNTGEEFATQFSNAENSLESSLGFYVTDETYEGDNGFSLRLNGMDKGFNDHALARSIVMHGADYVNEDFAKTQKRIGRSWGCPALPRDLAAPIINTLKNKNCLFIYYPDENYLHSSEWLNG